MAKKSTSSIAIAKIVDLLVSPCWDNAGEGAMLVEETWQGFLELKPSLNDVMKVVMGKYGVKSSRNIQRRATELAIELHKDVSLQPGSTRRQLSEDELREIIRVCDWSQVKFIADRAVEELAKIVFANPTDHSLIGLAYVVKQSIKDWDKKNILFSEIIKRSKEVDTKDYVREIFLLN